MLDEFSATRIDAKAAPTSTAKKPDVPLDERGAEPSMEDFSAQLQKEMATLMGEANESPEMKQQFETMIKELGGTAEVVAERSAAGGSTSDSKSKGGDDAFQETIRKTMERMQASGDQASAAATSSDSDDLLAQMLKGMQGGGSEEDFSKMLLGMMEQLTNKEILYEPMKELHDKFPRWMEKNQGTTPEKDLSRFKEQQRLVEEIVSRFETKGYSDENPEDREFIVERMQQVRCPELSCFCRLLCHRCKPLAARRAIWSEICKMHKQRSVTWKPVAHNNNHSHGLVHF